MEALKKPDQDIETTDGPADEAGIFLSGVERFEYHLLEDSSAIFEATMKIKELQRAGRLVGMTALPGYVSILAASGETKTLSPPERG